MQAERVSAQRAQCVVISIGSNGEWEFEEDIVKRTRCTVHTFDCTVPTSAAPLRLHRANLRAAGPLRGRFASRPLWTPDEASHRAPCLRGSSVSCELIA